MRFTVSPTLLSDTDLHDLRGHRGVWRGRIRGVQVRGKGFRLPQISANCLKVLFHKQKVFCV